MISTGIAELDAALGGGLEGVTAILGGTGAGKSTLARHLALQALSSAPKSRIHVLDSERSWEKHDRITHDVTRDGQKAHASIQAKMGTHAFTLIENTGMFGVPDTGVASGAKFWTTAVQGFHRGCLENNAVVVMSWQLQASATGQAPSGSVPVGVHHVATNILLVSATREGDFRVTVQKSRYGVQGQVVDLVADRVKREIRLRPIQRRSVWERLMDDE